MNDRRTVTVRQAMALTGFSRSHIYVLVKSGAWRHLKNGDASGTIRIFVHSIDTWMTQHARGGEPLAPTSRERDADRDLPAVERPAFS